MLGKYIEAPLVKRWVCELPWSKNGSGNLRFQADAHLIAAAPELLEACQYICAELHNGATMRDEAVARGVRMAEEIIAKAEGKDK